MRVTSLKFAMLAAAIALWACSLEPSSTPLADEWRFSEPRADVDRVSNPDTDVSNSDTAAGPDAGVATECTPGQDQTCNDDPFVSAVWGRCDDTGTCSCREDLERNPVTGRCRPPGPNLVIGQPCEVGADCGDGYICQTAAPEGYCLLAGSGCSNNEDCPDGTICSPMPWSAISGVCMRGCEAVDDCRQGYVCDFVELFPGEGSSPRSSAPACWYVPE